MTFENVEHKYETFINCFLVKSPKRRASPNSDIFCLMADVDLQIEIFYCSAKTRWTRFQVLQKFLDLDRFMLHLIISHPTLNDRVGLFYQELYIKCDLQLYAAVMVLQLLAINSDQHPNPLQHQISKIVGTVTV